MGDAFVSGLVSDMLMRLGSKAFQEFSRLRRLKADVSALMNTYTHIQAVLSEAEVKQREGDMAVKEWLNRLRSASLEMENLIDDVLADTMLQRLHNEWGIKYKVRAFFSSNHNPLLVRTRVANKVKTIRTKLDMIAKDKSQFNFNGNTLSVDVGVGSVETTSLVPVFKIYGRDEEVKTVVKKICSKDIIGDDSTQGFRVYAIWGLGGVGKTTLAQLVYNHEDVKAHFELLAWVHVTSEFNVKKITKGIIESIDKCTCELPQLDAMQEDLRKKFKGKRCFIVLDDVWIEKPGEMNKWEELSKALSGAAKGSIVMVTTRYQTTSQNFAKVPGFQHQVGCLSEEDSWSLFKKLAFVSGSGREGENIRELESIGKEIVNKCKGLPLAVNTMGGLMSSQHTLSDWNRVNASVVWELQENGILPALKLSYDNLRQDEKRCFTYCCLFPKGYEMSRNLLIELWIINGFITPREQATLYQIGDQIFNCLVSRSFLQDVQERYDYRNHSELVCKMHDLMHDLAQNVMKQDFYVNVGKTLITPGKGEILHFSSTCSEFSFLEQDLERLRSLRSIFMFVDEYKGDIISQICNHLYLRILLLNGIKELRLPESICKLKHLRYLSMSRSNIKTLPESIVYLCNLQVLNVQRCRELRKLPKGLRYMKNLQCLYNKGCWSLKCMPVGIKELSCLRRLEVFNVGFKEGAQIKELGNLNLTGEELLLKGLENVGGLEDAKSAKLKNKTNLKSLALNWSDRRNGGIDEEVLEGLEPNSSLNELRIRNYIGNMISPSWMMKLGNLVKILFLRCECESIPSLGKFPSLRVIKLWRMKVLKCLDDDEFPSLQELHIGHCDDLVSLPSNLPKLSKLRIECCPALHCLPDGLKELTSLKIWGCENLRRRCEKEKGEDWPKISHVPNLDLDPPETWSENLIEDEVEDVAAEFITRVNLHLYNF